MSITLTQDLETALTEQAQRQGTTVEQLALKTLQDHFLATDPELTPRDEWERELVAMARDCGVSLSNEAVSSEGIYE